MTLTQIRYFLELCKTMNFTKAAENLFVAQPTLSRQVQLLETELDVTLLKRSRREVILTQAGETFRNEFSKIDDEIELAVMRVKKAGEPCREIRVGFSEPVLPIYVLNLVEQLKDCFPEYSIQMSQGYYYEMMHQFERGMLDIVASIEKIDYKNWNTPWQQICALPAYFTYSPQLFPEGYQPTIEDFKGKKFIFSSRSGAENIVRRQREILESVGITVTEDRCLFANDVLSTLMAIHCRDSFSVFCNPSERGLITLPLPEQAEKFRMAACWNQKTAPHLTKFFHEMKTDARYESSAL